MSDDLRALETWCQPLLEKLNGTQRARLTRTLAARLRHSQAARIGLQRNPDGSAYAPRKPRLRDKKGRIKRQMFSRMRTNKHLRATGDANTAAVQFIGRVARIAGVHQRGETERLGKSGPRVRYEQRELLGFTAADQRVIRDTLVHFLAE
jgi:phage virion morphogenesis protein